MSRGAQPPVPHGMERWTSGTGQHLLVHLSSMRCQLHGCCIHNPTDPHQDWPTHFREDIGLVERICPHGVGHPDKDSVAFFERKGVRGMGVHGCCGECPCGAGT